MARSFQTGDGKGDKKGAHLKCEAKGKDLETEHKRGADQMKTKGRRPMPRRIVVNHFKDSANADRHEMEVKK